MNSPAMIVVHHLENSRSRRILWMPEELGLDYEVERYEREPSMLAPASLSAIHPLGKAPVISDDDRVLAESGAILDPDLRLSSTASMLGPPTSAPAPRAPYELMT